MEKDLLRFSIIGNVDDGKSTLLGRLLLDTKSLFQDQLDEIERSSKRRGEDYLNLALLTDGLKSEREQGITIDVAYRYFATEKRKFIIADCPGHKQYTRNMVTGTSTAQACVIMIDARLGLQEQTRRHAFIASMMAVKHLIVCVNKMDLVNYSEKVFNQIKKEMTEYLSRLDIQDVHFIPMSALSGDNVVSRSQTMPWYQGSSLLYILENLHLASDYNFKDPRFVVQRVIRPMSHEWHDFRGYAGRIESGVYKPGDEVVVLPAGIKSRISKIYFGESEVKEAFFPMSVVMTLEEEVDLSRGDLIVRDQNRPQETSEIDALLCWMDQKSLNSGRKYTVIFLGKAVQAKVKEVVYKINIETLHRDMNEKNLEMNGIGRVKLKLASSIYSDDYKKSRHFGSFILVDDQNLTVAAGILKT